MKIERLFIYCLLAGTSLLTSCSKEVADSNRLPDGKYPVTFIATGLDVMTETRATADGTWTTNDEVAVQVNGMTGVKKYTADGNDASVTLNPADANNTFYWQNTGNINVSAWYCGTGYRSTLPTEWKVKPNQDTGNNYQQSDFLYAPQTALDFKGTKSLAFYHQTAKVVINIRKYGVATGEIDSVKIHAVKDGYFTTTLTNNCGLSAKTGENMTPSEIKPFKLLDANRGVVFEDEKNAEDALASYQALVIPQALSSSTTIEIEIKGYYTFKYTPTGEWKGGTQYTYNLTIKGSEVTATVITGNMAWTEGGTGSGTVEI